MTTLVVVQETGRTKSILEIVRQLLAQSDEKIIFLVVGQAARKIFANMPDSDPLKANVTTLAEFFDEGTLKIIEEQPLTADQLAKIKKKFLDKLDISKIIIGSPSWLNAYAPFQIAEVMADKVSFGNAFIYDGDFYKEKGCVYWTTLEQPDTAEFAWRKKYIWLASLEGSKALIPQAIRSQLQIEVVGDPAIDVALNPATLSAADQDQVQKVLEISNRQKLLLVSGTKLIADDINLVEALLKQDITDKFQVRIVLHPGVLNYNEHIEAYLALFENYAQAYSTNIVINDAMALSIKPEFLTNDFIVKSNVDREKIALLAERLCCCIPGTQATQAAISGIPVYCHLTQHTSYMPQGRVDTGEQGLMRFLAKDRVKQAPLTRAELGLTEKLSADIVTGIILKKKITDTYAYSVASTVFAVTPTPAVSVTATATLAPRPD
jgi:hypothetical protein